jgi:hypothetical protein
LNTKVLRDGGRKEEAKKRRHRAFGLLDAKHRREEGINNSLHIITFTSLPNTTNIPTGKQKLN